MLSEKVRNFDKKVTEIRVSEIRVSEIRVSEIRVSKIRVTEIRVSKIRVTEIRVSEIRVSEIRISSNHRELHGAIFWKAEVDSPTYVRIQHWTHQRIMIAVNL